MKRKKTIKYHVGGVSGDDIAITIDANFGCGMMRAESKDRMEALASRVVLALSSHTLLPITAFKVR